MPRSRFYPPDDVTAGEWAYLAARFPVASAEERREWIGVLLKQLTRRGLDPVKVHTALMLGIDRFDAHAKHQRSRTLMKRRNAAIARARRDVDRAIASLRALGPSWPHIDDDAVFQLRGLLMKPFAEAPAARPRPGRPWDWKQTTEQALKEAGVAAADRHQLIAALGFSGSDSDARALK